MTIQIYLLLLFIAFLGPQAAEVRRRNLETEQLALLEAKTKRGEEVRARKTSDEELSETNLEKIEEE